MNKLLVWILKEVNVLTAVVIIGITTLIFHNMWSVGGSVVGFLVGLVIAGLVCGVIATLSSIHDSVVATANASTAMEGHMRRLVSMAAVQNQVAIVQLAEYDAMTSTTHEPKLKARA